MLSIFKDLSGDGYYYNSWCLQESFEGVRGWLEEVKVYASTDVCKLLVGNKCDLTEKREVDFLSAKVRIGVIWDT